MEHGFIAETKMASSLLQTQEIFLDLVRFKDAWKDFFVSLRHHFLREEALAGERLGRNLTGTEHYTLGIVTFLWKFLEFL